MKNFLRSFKTRISKSPKIQSGLLLVLIVWLGAILIGEMVRPYFAKGRAEVARMLTYTLYGDHIAPGASDAKRLNAITEGARYYNVDIWIVNSRGKVLASVNDHSIPLDWELIAKSDEEMSPAVTDITRVKQLFTLKLAGSVPKYLLFYFTGGPNGGVVGIISILLLIIYMVGAGILVTIFYRGATEKFMKEAKSQAGFSLLGAVVSVFIMTLVLYGLSQIITSSMRGSAHADLKLALRNLSDTVKQSVSCANTFKHLDPSVVCTSSNPVPVLLYDAEDKPMTEPLYLDSAPSGNFDPEKDQSLYGAGKFGNWYLRAYCQTTTQNLVIRFAKVKQVQGATVTFANDPLLKRPYNWENSANNPLFGGIDNTICNGAAKPARAYGLIGAQTFFRKITGGGDMNIEGVPSSTRLIKVTSTGANLMTYGSADGDAASEDKADLQAIFNVSDPSNLTSSGYFSIIAGTNPGNVVLFSWIEQPNQRPIKIDGWDDPVSAAGYSPLVYLAAKWRPVFSYDTAAKRFTLALPTYAPAAFAYLVEFYGE